MVFSSPEFLFIFMPIFFLQYFLVKAKQRNAVIVILSLIFYSIGGGYITIILILSIILNYVIAKEIGKPNHHNDKWLLLGIASNLIPLIYFKYSVFFLKMIGDSAGVLGVDTNIHVPKIALPLGISFYTFHGISYLIDVYKRKVVPAASLVDFGMYMVNFPQLIAGPIVRYVEIVQSVRCRPLRTEQVFSGILRFMTGLGKKLILADNVGSIADRIFALPRNELTISIAWLGVITYTLQIYYDFSGYSDMAIGLGRIMGFEFPENFNQPYRSQSVTEFWRRWHMTLSRWFRDYVYIPLGGNRAGPIRTYINLVIVFLLCGLWHGAAYTFVFWGLYHGMLLMLERFLHDRFGVAPSGWLGQLQTLLLVMVGWVFFRADSLNHAVGYLAAMFVPGQAGSSMFSPAFYLTNDKVAAVLAGWLFALFPFELLRRWAVGTGTLAAAQIATIMALLVYSSALVAANGFNPFIYFRF